MTSGQGGKRIIIDPSRMVPVNGSGPDGEVAVEALQGTTKGAVSLVAVYSATAFDLFHVGETVRKDFRSRNELVTHLSSFAEETRREFTERGLFSGLSPVQNSVEYRFEERDSYGASRVYCGDRGMLLFVDPDENVEPLVKTMSQLLGGV